MPRFRACVFSSGTLLAGVVFRTWSAPLQGAGECGGDRAVMLGTSGMGRPVVECGAVLGKTVARLDWSTYGRSCSIGDHVRLSPVRPDVPVRREWGIAGGCVAARVGVAVGRYAAGERRSR